MSDRRKYPDDEQTAILIPERSAHEPNTSWWLIAKDFYVNAKVREKEMRLSRFGQHQIFTTGKDSER